MSDAAPALQVDDGFAPEQFGPYMLLAHLGRGGMADVFKAREDKAYGISRFVVLKRILTDYSADGRFVELFLNEARIASQLSHAHIAHIYDVGEIDGVLYMTMEYVRGLDLLRLMDRARGHGTLMPPLLGVYVLRQIASALAAAHGHTGVDDQPHPIIHRDISPPNIMISKDGQVKLVDFGIAKAISAHKEAMRTQAMKGKIGYMAPEQLSYGICTPQSDLFAAGIVLHEALTGQLLFHGQTDYDTMTRVMGAPIPKPSALNPAVPPELDRVVLRALQRKPEDRYQNATDLARDLEEILQATRFHAEMVTEFVTAMATAKDRETWAQATLSGLGSARSADHKVLTAEIVARASRAALTPRRDPPRLPAAPRLAPPAAYSTPSRRPRGWRAAMAGLLVVLPLVALAAGWYLRPRKPPRPAPEPPVQVASPAPAAAAPQPEVTPVAAADLAAPAAPSQESPPTLELDTEPSGAVVYAGPRRLGRTPLTLQLRSEAMVLSLASEGRPELRYTVHREDAPSLVLRLPPPREPAENKKPATPAK